MAREKQKPRVLVLAGFGLNCELETAGALCEMGADARIVHFSQIQNGTEKLEKYGGFVIPGGWSFGDDIASGRVLANRIKYRIWNQMKKFVDEGKPVVGICNGFQMLVKLGLLPNIEGKGGQEFTLTNNASGKFEDRWVNLVPAEKTKCIYANDIKCIAAPVRHGEGRLVAKDNAALLKLEEKGLAVFRYADMSGKRPKEGSVGYPANPNGAANDIAGICDVTGKIFGMMPHPECSIYEWQCPRWRSGFANVEGSRKFYGNIVKAAAKF